MHGTMLVLEPDAQAKRIDFDRAPDLDELKAAIGGGWLEKVPGFDSIRIATGVYSCVALCDEDGKYKGMPLNREATARWHAALLASGHPGLIDAAERVVDVLVGPVAVLFGDDDFMEAL